jgi:hypothetical protein
VPGLEAERVGELLPVPSEQRGCAEQLEHESAAHEADDDAALPRERGRRLELEARCGVVGLDEGVSRADAFGELPDPLPDAVLVCRAEGAGAVARRFGEVTKPGEFGANVQGSAAGTASMLRGGSAPTALLDAEGGDVDLLARRKDDAFGGNPGWCPPSRSSPSISRAAFSPELRTVRRLTSGPVASSVT